MLAVPHEKAAPLMPAGALPAGTVQSWAGLGASPIVNVHVIYDRPVLRLPFAAGIDSPVQWVFDRTQISGLHLSSPGQQYLAISLSAADDYVDTPAAELREQFVPALAELIPAAREAQIAEFFVTRERRATFRQEPGHGVLLITHYTRILHYVQPDFVHVFVGGRIVEEGGPELADELEAQGYERFAAAGAPAQGAAV